MIAHADGPEQNGQAMTEAKGRRLGELLMQAELVTATELANALRHQAVYGRRLGTNLIELGYATEDDVARGLAGQLDVPAALNKHFVGSDPAAVQRIQRDVAAWFAAIPLAFAATTSGQRLVVCFRDPRSEDAIEAVSRAAEIEVVPCVGPELAIFRWLERRYDVQRQQRYRHVRPRAGVPPPLAPSDSRTPASPAAMLGAARIDLAAEWLVPGCLHVVGLDDQRVGRDPSQVRNEVGRHWLRDYHADTEADPRARDDSGPMLTEFEAVEAIRAAGHRDAVTSAVVAFLRGSFGAGFVAAAKEGVAFGQAGCGGLFDGTTAKATLIPLEANSVFRQAYETQQTFRGAPPADAAEVQQRFFGLFPLNREPSEVMVVPLIIGAGVVCLVYAHERGGGPIPERAAAELENVAREATEAFLRLIRNAKQL